MLNICSQVQTTYEMKWANKRKKKNPNENEKEEEEEGKKTDILKIKIENSSPEFAECVAHRIKTKDLLFFFFFFFST